MLFQQFYQMIEDLKIAKNNHKIVVAVSGGVDSVVLLHLLMRIPDANRPQLVIAHINHQLRAEATAEEVFVRGLAEHYHLPFYLHTWPVAKQPTSGIEEAARNMRYHFLHEVMNETTTDILMTGHHQDDQVETILMKLTRGSLLNQLTGIKLRQPFNTGELIRPLLSFSKEQIYDYAHHHELEYAEDASNQELTYSRNRFRNELIPQFKAENAQFNEHIEQFSSDLDDLLKIAEAPIQHALQELITFDSEKCLSFNQNAFLKHSKPMQRALLHKILHEIYQDSLIGYKANYIRLLQDWIISGAVNTELELSENRRSVKKYETIVFYIYEGKNPVADQYNETYEITALSKWVQVSKNEYFRLTEVDTQAVSWEETENALLISDDELYLPLTIRHRLPGDRMAYQGLNGTKKIKDIFIDGKVPPQERDTAWIVEDANKKIIWLVNYRKMSLLTPLETDRLCYILEYKKE